MKCKLCIDMCQLVASAILNTPPIIFIRQTSSTTFAVISNSAIFFLQCDDLQLSLFLQIHRPRETNTIGSQICFYKELLLTKRLITYFFNRTGRHLIGRAINP